MTKTFYPNVQVDDLEMDAITDDFELESSFRTLLNAVGGLPENNTQLDSHLTFEICMDGRNYTISIIEARIKTTNQHLTPREWDIIRLVSKGFRTKEIAPLLGLQPCTISTYVKRIYLKLNVSSRAEMVAKVLRESSLPSLLEVQN